MRIAKILLVLSFSCFLLNTAHAYDPPIGIPAPEFGIDETVESIYGSADYYTHYVDNTDPEATDSGNPYGTADTPRLTFPSSSYIAPGAVIEIHGGPYKGRFWFTNSGTETQPIFIRGVSEQSRAVFIEDEWRIRGHHIIIENIEFDKRQKQSGAIDIRPGSAEEQVHHVSVRNCEVHNFYYDDCATISMFSAAGMEDNIAHDIVFYNNYIHPDDLPDEAVSYEKDTTGVGIGNHSDGVWILDNHIYNCAGDAVGTGHTAYHTAKNYYIGRNTMYHCGENAVDLKAVENVVVSQNIMHDFYGESAGSPGGGVGVVIHYGESNKSTINAWVLFNEIYNANNSGIQVGGDQRHDAYIIGNIIHDIHNEDNTARGFRSWGAEKLYLVGNVFYNVDNGIDSTGTSETSQMILYNNIVSKIKTGRYHLLLDPSDYRDVAEISHNIFYQPGGQVVINWDSDIYDVFGFQEATGKGEGCIEEDPLFVDPDNNDFRLQFGSPAIDAGIAHEVYQLFEDAFTFGLGIRVDYEGISRPQGSEHDIGTYEYLPLTGPVDPVPVDTTPPEITNLSVVDGQQRMSSPIILEGNIIDENPPEFIIINGEDVDLVEGHFSILVNLHEGANLFKIEAEDTEGNKAQRIIGVFYISFGVDRTSPSKTEPSMDARGSWYLAGKKIPWISPLVKDTYADKQSVSYNVNIPKIPEDGFGYILIPTIWYEKSGDASEGGNYYLTVSMGGIKRTQKFTLSGGLNKPKPVILDVRNLEPGRYTLTLTWQKSKGASEDAKIIVRRIFFKQTRLSDRGFVSLRRK